MTIQKYEPLQRRGKKTPFELDSSLLLSSGRHGGVVRGSTTYNFETPLLARFG